MQQPGREPGSGGADVAQDRFLLRGGVECRVRRDRSSRGHGPGLQPAAASPVAQQRLFPVAEVGAGQCRVRRQKAACKGELRGLAGVDPGEFVATGVIQRVGCGDGGLNARAAAAAQRGWQQAGQDRAQRVVVIAGGEAGQGQ